MGFPYGVGDRAAKLMPPPILGREAALNMCLDPPRERRWQHEGLACQRRRSARGVRHRSRHPKRGRRGTEELRRQDSIHAAAVVISPVPLTELVPIQQKGDGVEIVTQYEMHAIEDLGLLKMDFLGLRNLSIIERTLELIESAGPGGQKAEGPIVDIDNVPLDDPATFELLRSAQTIGVFQLEGSAMRGLIRNLAPDRFEDVIALVALYRPGPMRRDAHALRRPQERRGGGGPPPRHGADPGAQLRHHGVPGTGAPGRSGHGRVLDGRGGEPAPRHGEEDPGGDAPKRRSSSPGAWLGDTARRLGSSFSR